MNLLYLKKTNREERDIEKYYKVNFKPNSTP